ncbi:MAG TPA: transketolase C-terminal domain-containing protein, partial [Alcanivoracaceae bacterium]|nr:transketolase C-terminal domain-containing protein [Alcanivoracaceae bacterium]
LYSAWLHEGPSAVRYPRGKGPGANIEKTFTALPIGKGRIMREGKKVAIVSFGVMLAEALKAAETLDATVADMRWVKPLDHELLRTLAQEHDVLVTIEDHQIMTGAGSAVNEFLHAEGLMPQVINLGLPDAFTDHGKREALLAQLGLDAEGIVSAVKKRS